MLFDFKASNNEAKYEAFIAGIRMAKEIKISHLVVHSDLHLVVSQINEIYQTEEERMNNYLQVAKKKLENF